MKIEVELTDREAQLLHTLIRRSIFEDYIRPMAECNDTPEDTTNRVYDTIEAALQVRRAIEKEWEKKRG